MKHIKLSKQLFHCRHVLFNERRVKLTLFLWIIEYIWAYQKQNSRYKSSTQTWWQISRLQNLLASYVPLKKKKKHSLLLLYSNCLSRREMEKTCPGHTKFETSSKLDFYLRKRIFNLSFFPFQWRMFYS